MEYVNAKRSFNAAKRSLILNTNNVHQICFGYYPIAQSQSGEVSEYSLEIKGETFGTCREIVLPDFWIQISDLDLSHRLCLHADKRQDTYQMHFTLLEQPSVPNQDFYFDIINGTSNFLFLPKHLSDYQEYSETRGYITFEVNFHPDYFHQQFVGFSTLYPEFFSRVRKNEAALLSNSSLAMLPKMKQIVNEIIKCQLKAPFKSVYLTAKVHELLVLQMEQFSEQKQQKYPFNQADSAKLALVKEILLSRQKTPSLHELSLESGLNLDKLKKGFKALYGTTVFGYLNDIKMEEAHQRLLSIDSTVSEVAEKAGYKNPQHFTAAFKRKYGVLPKDLRH